MTQLGQRKLAQSKQRATASDSVDLQPVQRTPPLIAVKLEPIKLLLPFWQLVVDNKFVGEEDVVVDVPLLIATMLEELLLELVEDEVLLVVLTEPLDKLLLPPRQRGQGASPGFDKGASRHKSQLSTSQIAESLAGGELPLTVNGDSEAKEPREFARDSRDGVGDAIFSQPAYL